MLKVQTLNLYLFFFLVHMYHLHLRLVLFALVMKRLNRKNIIIILMSIELILASVNINFVVFSSYLGDLVGQVFTMFILTVAAAEAAIGLAILVCFYRLRNSIFIEDANTMKG